MITLTESDVVQADDYQYLPRFEPSYSLSASAEPDLEVTFRWLADNWKKTRDMSVLSRRYQDASYNRILQLGPCVIPLILRELQIDPDRWLDALEHLTKESPAKGAKTFDDAVNCWITWGIEHKYIL